jgi:hypothetical protein
VNEECSGVDAIFNVENSLLKLLLVAVCEKDLSTGYGLNEIVLRLLVTANIVPRLSP